MGDPAATPRDVTSWFVAQLIANGKISLAKNLGGIGAMGNPISGMLDKGLKLRWFKKQVQNGGPWDFKNNALKADKAAGVLFAGTHYRYDMPGNFHYGFVGALAGFSATLLEAAAGKAQLDAGTSKPEFWCTSFDDPEDNAYVGLGIRLAKSKAFQVAASDVDAMLKKFVHVTCAPPGKYTQMIIDQVF